MNPEVNLQWLKLLVACSSVVLVRLPYLGLVFRTFCTLIHESAHAFAGLLLNQQIVEVHLQADVSGAAIIKGGNRFTNSLIAFVGYPIANATALFFAWMMALNEVKVILLVTLALGFVNLIFWVRNLFGVLWILVQSAVTIGLLWLNNSIFLQFYAGFITYSLFAEAIYSSGVILKLSFTESKKAGDATLLAKFTGIPAVVWGGIFFAQSMAFAYVTLKVLVPTF